MLPRSFGGALMLCRKEFNIHLHYLHQFPHSLVYIFSVVNKCTFTHATFVPENFENICCPDGTKYSSWFDNIINFKSTWICFNRSQLKTRYPSRGEWMTSRFCHSSSTFLSCLLDITNGSWTKSWHYGWYHAQDMDETFCHGWNIVTNSRNPDVLGWEQSVLPCWDLSVLDIVVTWGAGDGNPTRVKI